MKHPDATVLVESVADADRARASRDTPPRVHHADDPVGGRDARDHRRAAAPFPADRRPGPRRHLLRDVQPAMGGEGAARRGRLLLVVGSRNSSIVTPRRGPRAAGVPAYLVDDASEIDEAGSPVSSVVGVTSGASVPERLVGEVCDWFGEHGVRDIDELTPRSKTSCSVFRSSSAVPSVRLPDRPGPVDYVLGENRTAATAFRPRVVTGLPLWPFSPARSGARDDRVHRRAKSTR